MMSMSDQAMQHLGTERLDRVHSDADLYRVLSSGSPWRLARRASETAAIVRHGMEALAECRWERAVYWARQAERGGAGSPASLGLDAIVAELHGEERADSLYSELRQYESAADLSTSVWACSKVACALHESREPRQPDPLLPLALCERMNGKARELEGAPQELLCLSLALLARSARNQILAAALFAHLAADARRTMRDPAYAAAMGVCAITLGDLVRGSSILTVAVNREARRHALAIAVATAQLADAAESLGDSRAATLRARSRQLRETHGLAIPA